MDVFISWSEARSRIIAEALREWMPQVINAIEPWVSSQDIDPGARWSPKLANRLDKTGFGIICLTPENPDKPWILFEAGALSKIVDKSNVVPYLYELKPSDLQGPLAQFQAIQANKDDTRKLMTSINKAVAADGGGAIGDEVMTKSFNKWWPELEQKLEDVPDSPIAKKPKRSDREILEEILSLARKEAREREMTPRAVITATGDLSDEEEYIETLYRTRRYLETKHKITSDPVERKDLEAVINNVQSQIARLRGSQVPQWMIDSEMKHRD